MAQLECRIVITNYYNRFELGMWDPLNMRYEPLGTHPLAQQDKVVRDLKERIEKERHNCTFSEWTGPR